MTNGQRIRIDVTQPSWLWGRRASRLPIFDQARCLIAPQAGSLCYRKEETK